MKFDKKVIFIILLLVIFFIYLKTAPSSLAPGDPGELITAAYTLGIAHPPGYPLYVLLNKVFTCIFPIGNIAFRVNILTILFSILGLTVFYFTINAYFNSIIISIFSVSFLAFSQTLWAQSLIGEVYSLTFLFFCILLYLELNKPDSLLIYYIYGLSITIHHTMLIFMPFLLFKIWKEKRLNDYKVYLLFILGISANLYLFIRSANVPLFNWGNPSTLKSFYHHITRTEYSSIIKNSFSFIVSIEQIWRYIVSLSLQFTPILLIAGIFGSFFLSKKRWAFMSAFAISGIGVILLLNIQLNPRNLFDIEVFYIPSYVLFSFFIGAGIQWIENKSNDTIKYATITILSFILSYQIFINYKTNNRSEHYFSYNYGNNILKTIRKDGLIFAEKDNSAGSLSYLMLVEDKRKDVIFYNPALQIIRNIYPSTKNENEKYIKNKITWAKIPVYRSNPSANLHREGMLFANYYSPIVINHYYNFSKIKDPVTINYDFETRDIIIDELFSEVEYFNLRKNKLKAWKIMEFITSVGKDKVDVLTKLALFYEFDKKYIKALDHYSLALKIAPLNIDILNSIGFTYFELGNYTLSNEFHQKVLKLNPNSANAYFGIAQNDEKFGRLREAARNWQKYLELEKENSVWKLEAERHIGHLQKGIIK